MFATAIANATASLFAGMYAAMHHAEERHIHEFQQGSRTTPISSHDCSAYVSKPAQTCYITAADSQSHSAVTWVAMIRWTQWIFIQLFNKGLAYQAEVAVNWCPALGTVLANEEIIDGKSERGDHPVVRMPMKQVGTLQPISACLTVCELFTQLVLMYYYGRSVLPYDNTCRLGNALVMSHSLLCYGHKPAGCIVLLCLCRLAADE